MRSYWNESHTYTYRTFTDYLFTVSIVRCLRDICVKSYFDNNFRANLFNTNRKYIIFNFKYSMDIINQIFFLMRFKLSYLDFTSTVNR